MLIKKQNTTYQCKNAQTPKNLGNIKRTDFLSVTIAVFRTIKI